jgi:hypothetical protein
MPRLLNRQVQAAAAMLEGKAARMASNTRSWLNLFP